MLTVKSYPQYEFSVYVDYIWHKMSELNDSN